MEAEINISYKAKTFLILLCGVCCCLWGIIIFVGVKNLSRMDGEPLPSIENNSHNFDYKPYWGKTVRTIWVDSNDGRILVIRFTDGSILRIVSPNSIYLTVTGNYLTIVGDAKNSKKQEKK